MQRERLLELSKPSFGSFKAFIKTSDDKMAQKNNNCLLSCRSKKEVYSLHCVERASQSAEESKDDSDEDANATFLRMWRRYFSNVVVSKVRKH